MKYIAKEVGDMCQMLMSLKRVVAYAYEVGERRPRDGIEWTGGSGESDILQLTALVYSSSFAAGSVSSPNRFARFCSILFCLLSRAAWGGE